MTFKVGDMVQFTRYVGYQADPVAEYGTIQGVYNVSGQHTIATDDGELFYRFDKELRLVTPVGERATVPSELLPQPAPLKTVAQVRKGRPLARGVLDYFPDALMGVAEVSRVGNEQHNAGQPMHWAYDKSTDEADCLVRHLTDRGTLDTDGLSHTGKVAWRALAM